MRKRLVVPIYKVPVLVFDSNEEATAYVAKNGGPELSADDFYGFCSVAEGAFVMSIDKQYERPSLIAHESLHAAWGVLDHIGVSVEAENHEALAHLQGWLIDRWYEWRRKCTAQPETS